jgi:PAS domain S-box-containing protein
MGGQPDGQSDLLAAALLNSSHDAVVGIDTRFTVVFWNPAAELLFGYPSHEIIGRPWDLLVPPERHADQREILSLVAAGARVDRYRTRRLHRDGHEVPVSLAISPLCDADGTLIGLSAIARKVSERERLEASFQAVLEAAPDAVVGVADDGRVVLANTQAEHMFGLARHGLIGRPIDKLISPWPGPEGSGPGHRTGQPGSGPGHRTGQPGSGPGHRTGQPDRAGRPGRPGRGPGTSGEPAEHPPSQPTLAHQSDGGAVPVEITLSMLDTDLGRVRCAVIRDITERLRAQDEHLRLSTEAERARVEAQLHRTRRLESLGQLAGGIAHDFNNIIAVIVNYASLIAEDAAAAGFADIASDAEQVSRAAQRGAELTHQLLAFARREVVRPRALDLNQVITQVEDMLRRSIGEHIALRTDLAGGLPAVTADPGQIEQVLVNLAVNARDAMPGGGSLTIETRLLPTDAPDVVDRPPLRPGRYVRLRVSDTGTGMPREVVDRAFEPFFTTKSAGQGTGLGLATVYGIVTAAGGDLAIHSEPGAGTSITVLLPATDEQPTELRPAERRAVEGGGETILVVEDEAPLREVIHRILTTSGYRVLLADSGPAALELAASSGQRIDVLLTDVVMPQMLGKELVERITATRPDIRVLYMSGYAQPVLASQGTLDADVALIEKPFTKSQLLTALRHRLAAPS